MLVDATLGLGGHAEQALRTFPDLHLVGLDRDPEALRLLERSGCRRSPTGRPWCTPCTTSCRTCSPTSATRSVQGILFDLGVSSMQLDERDRGFAYSQDAPLDMRMDPTTGLTAADILNTYPAADLARILRQYGEERFANRIAARVVVERKVQPFTTSARLVELIRESIPAPARRTGGNPAKRTFQALRIEVNGELDSSSAGDPGRPRLAWPSAGASW